MEKEVITIKGKIEQAYEWSAGLAGSIFLKELRDRGRIMGTKCSKCNRVIIPPRIFCERCFSRLDEWEVVGDTGTINCFTISYVGINAERLKEPVICAVIDLDGADGGLYHYLGEVDNPDELKIGMRVKAVFKDKKDREGSILDIKYFKPI
ncbi:MAG: hypothetical protein COS84_09650 [Armatimonadetes bacterium CG07_land_8_20_14_0_80_40_9]|nr:MAG: hypothetical protein COS84_09650 [Armatimonadetes bacterium CG07_land_8_20_14_0_80_40_9]